MLYYQSLLYIPKVIRSELINKHHNNPFTNHFYIKNTRELIAKKYYKPILQQNVEAYVKGCDVCLALKAVYYKPYEDLQVLPIPTY